MEVVPAAEGFTPESIGKALAQSWHVNGLNLQLIQVVEECPITHEAMTNRGMTADGFVYQMGWIMTWLGDNGRSPLTNLELAHRRILRLGSVQEILNHFFVACRTKRSMARAGQEAAARHMLEKQVRDDTRLLGELRELEAYIQECASEIEEWRRHVLLMRGMADQIWADLRDRSARLIQRSVRCAVMRDRIKKLLRAEEASRSEAALRAQSAYRSVLARRRVAPMLAQRRHELEQRRQLSIRLLLAAAGQGNAARVQTFLAQGIDANLSHVGQNGESPLYAASQNGHLEVVRLLCEAGADKDKANQNGTSPLFIASMNGHLEVVRLLRKAGAS